VLKAVSNISAATQLRTPAGHWKHDEKGRQEVVVEEERKHQERIKRRKCKRTKRTGKGGERGKGRGRNEGGKKEKAQHKILVHKYRLRASRPEVAAVVLYRI
jgi:hypothetical protein